MLNSTITMLKSLLEHKDSGHNGRIVLNSNEWEAIKQAVEGLEELKKLKGE